MTVHNATGAIGAKGAGTARSGATVPAKASIQSVGLSDVASVERRITIRMTGSVSETRSSTRIRLCVLTAAWRNRQANTA